MNKINWKVRLKNPTFWLTFIPALTTFVYSVLGMFEVVPTISEDNVLQVCQIIISALASLGVLVDPTTKGIGDSRRAMYYNKPHEDSEEK